MIKCSVLRALMVATGMLFSLVAVTPANAVVELNINKGNVQPLPIAITDFISGDGIGAHVGGEEPVGGSRHQARAATTTGQSIRARWFALRRHAQCGDVDKQ